MPVTDELQTIPPTAGLLGPWTVMALDMPGRRLIVSHDEQYGWVALIGQVAQPVFAANGTGPGEALAALEQTLVQMGVRA
jgi:hypothetical protein